jgi:CRP-like cAMP-binding protein
MKTPTKKNEQVLDEFFKGFKLSKESVGRVKSFLEEITIAPKQLFVKKNKPCKQLGFLVEGLLYAKFENKHSGEENVSRFYYSPKNIIVTSFDSFSSSSPANEDIECIEPSHLFCITRKDLQHLYDEVPGMERLGREIAEQSYIQALQYIRSMQALSVEKRIDDFLDQNPGLFNRIKRESIASYLGVHRNTLSRQLKKRK